MLGFSSTRKRHALLWSPRLKTMRVVGWRREPSVCRRFWLSRTSVFFLSLFFLLLFVHAGRSPFPTIRALSFVWCFLCCTRPSGTLLFNIAGSSSAGSFEKKILMKRWKGGSLTNRGNLVCFHLKKCEARGKRKGKSMWSAIIRIHFMNLMDTQWAVRGSEVTDVTATRTIPDT